MVDIPSLSHIQLRILRLAKKYSGKIIRLSYEIPIINNEGEPPIGYPAVIQKLVDLSLVEVQSRRVHRDASRFQKDCWAKYSAALEQPSIYAWELWRDKYIASQQESIHIVCPDEEFEHFSDVWIHEIGVRAIQPSEDAT